MWLLHPDMPLLVMVDGLGTLFESQVLRGLCGKGHLTAKPPRVDGGGMVEGQVIIDLRYQWISLKDSVSKKRSTGVSKHFFF